ncbi:ATP-binding protein [Actinomyces oricola]|nr:ATP-binding protein [Actinomyces oricola]
MPGLPAAPRPRRRFAGVCAGVAVHLGVPVARVRILALVLALGGGAGVLLYVLLWALVPTADPWAEAAGAVPPAQARLASRPTTVWALPTRVRQLLGGGALLLAALLLTLWRTEVLTPAGNLLPVLVIASGAALAWSQLDALTGVSRDRGALLRLAGGVVLAAVGILLWLGADTPPGILLTGTMTGIALVVGVALVLAPLWLRTNRALAETRAAEARAAERADIAAHLHDSVLQTLTLIRKRANDPGTVARLARSQERELRAWLYTDRPEAGTSLADELRELAAGIEDLHGIPIDVVCVGDREPGADAEAILAATREALSNAVRHGAPPVSVYSEASPQRLEVFVRDHGPGFDLNAVTADRHGVRESIIARVQRHGGSAVIKRLAQGTEVHLALPA